MFIRKVNNRKRQLVKKERNIRISSLYGSNISFSCKLYIWNIRLRKHINMEADFIEDNIVKMKNNVFICYQFGK